MEKREFAPKLDNNQAVLALSADKQDSGGRQQITLNKPQVQYQTEGGPQPVSALLRCACLEMLEQSLLPEGVPLSPKLTTSVAVTRLRLLRSVEST
jgi:hypothetical protein